jgi:transposase InsO family protein
MNRKYSPEMRERALRMLAETRPSHPNMMSAVRHVAGLLGISPDGRPKMHALMRRQGWEIGRGQTERLMRLAGVRGVKKSKRVFTTKSDRTLSLPTDLVNRRFTADAPRRLWVCDVTHVATWSGFACVAFVTGVYSRRIVGWNVAATLKAEILPLQALDMAAWGAGGDLTGLTHQSDHGSNYMAMVYTDRVVELGAGPSTGTVGDSFDNAMGEAVNNLYKTELIRQRGPWRTVEQFELPTHEYVWWWNNQRLHGELDMRTPIEVEDAYYADLESAQPGPAGQTIR